jgi:peroxiredoxin Q/BCP
LIAAGVLAVIALLGVIYLANRPKTAAGSYRYDVGTPGPGEPAPEFTLPSSDGSTVDLQSLRGQTVLLYFQEGLTCQPCWDQLTDIEHNMDSFRSLGIDHVVTITTDPVDALHRKVTDEGITTPVLSDQDLSVSSAYQTNSYGMMGNSRDGHSFIVVGPDGVIRWRADYGGPPDFTMFLPVPALLADISQGLGHPSP